MASRRTLPSLVALVLLTACAGRSYGPEPPSPPVAGPSSPSPLTVEPPPSKPERVRVPDLFGRTLRRARHALRARDLRPRVEPFRSTEYVPGRVTATRPDAGALRRPGSVVTLSVAKAPPSPPPPPPPPCTPGYSPCIPPDGDVDCAGGEGKGPRYEGQGGVPFGPFTVTGSDPYGLDGYDNDGRGCES
jgi:resuscitation-promoting factor RpfB